MIIYKLPNENNSIVKKNVISPFNPNKVYGITSSIGTCSNSGIVDDGFNTIVKHFSELTNKCERWDERLNLYRRFCMTVDYYTLED